MQQCLSLLVDTVPHAAPTPGMPCHALQDCLAKYSYNQAMCEREIQTLVDCCAQLPAPQGSVHCAGFMPRVRKAKEKLEKQQQEEHYKPSFPAERT